MGLLLGFNINKCVNVNLSDEGIKIYENFYTEQDMDPPHLVKDNDGLVEIQMWKFLQIFGPHLIEEKYPPFGVTLYFSKWNFD